MTHLETHYHVLFPQIKKRMAVPQPDDFTSRRPYLSEVLVPGRPLSFVSGSADMLGPGEVEDVDDLLFDGASFGVRDGLRAVFDVVERDGTQLYPMSYEDAGGTVHRDFWYLNIYQDLDFLDRTRATLLPGESPTADEVEVMQYAFDAQAMNAVPDDERLLFRLAGVIASPVFVHQTLLAALLQANATGFVHFRVAAFSDGQQYVS